MTPGRLARDVFVGTLCVDVFAEMIFRAGPAVPYIHGPGRWLICLWAGYMGVRSLGWLRTSFLTFGTMMIATVFTVAIYVLTGMAAKDQYGPASVIAMLLGTAMIGAVAPLVGASAAALRQRLSQRPAAG